MDGSTGERGVHVEGKDVGRVVEAVGGAGRAVSSAGAAWVRVGKM
jgi:hypothetical protein